MTPDEIKAMNNKPNPLPDVDALQEVVDTCCPNSGDHACLSCRAITRLLSTIPRDKSSAAYALWLFSQGYKRIRWSAWNEGQYIEKTFEGFVDEHKVSMNGMVLRDAILTGDEHWCIYEEPPAVDDDELRRKCVEYSRHMLTIPPVSECPRFTPAELQRLKELP